MHSYYCCCGNDIQSTEPAGWCAAHLPGALCARCAADASIDINGRKVCPSRLAWLRSTATVEEGIQAAHAHGPVVQCSPTRWYHAMPADRIVLRLGTADLRELAGYVRIATELGDPSDPYDVWADTAGQVVRTPDLPHPEHAALATALGEDPAWLRALCAHCQAVRDDGTT